MTDKHKITNPIVPTIRSLKLPCRNGANKIHLNPKGKEEEIISEKKEKYTILVAEDEEVNFMVLEILLLDKLKHNCSSKKIKWR